MNENYLAPVYASGNPDGNTNFGYYNADFEAAIAAGDQAATLDEAVTHYQEAEAILATDFPTVPLSFSVERDVLQRPAVQRRARPVQRRDQAAPVGGERRRVTPTSRDDVAPASVT